MTLGQLDWALRAAILRYAKANELGVHGGEILDVLSSIVANVIVARSRSKEEIAELLYCFEKVAFEKAQKSHERMHQETITGDNK